MTRSTQYTETAGQQDTGRSRPLNSTVDRVVSLLLVLTGAAFATGGALLYGFADRTRIARWVAEGRLTSTELTDAQLIDATYAALWGGGLGLVVTGVALVVTAVAFFALQRRARRRYEETGVYAPSTTGNAIVGAVVTVATSFVPFSPVLGGAVGGYLQGGDRTAGAKTGAIAGLFATIPVGFLYGAIAIALLAGSPRFSLIVGLVLTTSLLVALVYVIGLSALGGYVGSSVADGRAATVDDETPAA